MIGHKQNVDGTSSVCEVLVAGSDDFALDSLDKFFTHVAAAASIRKFENVQTALDADGVSLVVVPLSSPILVLATALHAGAAPVQALDEWRACAKNLMKACRKARQRVLLVDAAMLLEQPERMAQELNARFEIDFNVRMPLPQNAPVPVSLYRSMALALLSSDVEALAIRDEMEAMCLGPVNFNGLSLQDVEMALTEVSTLMEERDLLREYMQEMLMETGEFLNEREKLDASAQKARRGRDALKLELDEAKQHVQDLYQSTSWRVTAPLRAIRMMLRRS